MVIRNTFTLEVTIDISNRINVVSLKMVVNKKVVISSEEVNSKYIAGSIFQRELGELDRECFAVLCLDTKGKPTCFSIVHTGTLNQTLLHPREIFKVAISSNANSIIVGHNHPSGDVSPSQPDIENTKTIVSAGNLLGIQVLDHLIVSKHNTISLRSKNPKIFKEEIWKS